MLVLGAVGLKGSGKDTLIDYLCQRCGLPKLSIGDIVREIADKEGLPKIRDNLHQITERYMDRHGDNFFVQKLVHSIQAQGLKKVGVSGIRM